MVFGLKEGSFTASVWKVATLPLGLELPWQVQRWQMLRMLGLASHEKYRSSRKGLF